MRATANGSGFRTPRPKCAQPREGTRESAGWPGPPNSSTLRLLMSSCRVSRLCHTNAYGILGLKNTCTWVRMNSEMSLSSYNIPSKVVAIRVFTPEGVVQARAQPPARQIAKYLQCNSGKERLKSLCTHSLGWRKNIGQYTRRSTHDVLGNEGESLQVQSLILRQDR